MDEIEPLATNYVLKVWPRETSATAIVTKVDTPWGMGTRFTATDVDNWSWVFLNVSCSRPGGMLRFMARSSIRFDSIMVLYDKEGTLDHTQNRTPVGPEWSAITWKCDTTPSIIRSRYGANIDGGAGDWIEICDTVLFTPYEELEVLDSELPSVKVFNGSTYPRNS